LGLSSLAGSCSPAPGHFKAADTEADPAMSFGALLKLERYARIDRGAIINSPWQAILAQTLGIDLRHKAYEDGSRSTTRQDHIAPPAKSNMCRTKRPSCFMSRRRRAATRTISWTISADGAEILEHDLKQVADLSHDA
jgi:hypothetical protein